MCLNPNTPNSGFALPAAIFVLVVVSSMVLAMVRLSASQSASGVLSLLAARAFWAAQTGLEWGIDKVVADGSCGGFPANFTVDDYTVVLTCNSTLHDEESTTLTNYVISATATTTGQAIDSPDYVFKQLEAVIVL